MIDRFTAWQYRDDNNCWDFVREYLCYHTKVDPQDVPKFGICPDDKRGMTKAAIKVERAFSHCGPIDLAIGCQYAGKLLIHVGIVHGGKVKHVSSTEGYICESIDRFELRSKYTIYKIHNDLIGE